MQYLLLFLLCLLSVCSSVADDTEAARTRQKLNSIPMTQKAQLTEDEWQKILTPAQFFVLRQAGTEPPFKNEYWNTHEKGTYLCAACGNELFRSNTKFESGTGWPSFYAPLAQNKITVSMDSSGGMKRQEVKCARCGSHIGHVFKDGPAPTHLRYCLNSAALKLVRTTKGQ
jgi:peptide-methionine (R)-S-oxide reductase